MESMIYYTWKLQNLGVYGNEEEFDRRTDQLMVVGNKDALPTKVIYYMCEIRNIRWGINI